jgi:hypothetical protein
MSVTLQAGRFAVLEVRPKPGPCLELTEELKGFLEVSIVDAVNAKLFLR